MKRLIVAAFAVLFGALAVANAQEDAREEIIPIKPYFVTVYGGPTFSINENGGGYFAEDCPTELIDWIQGGIGAGYYFSNRYGARLSLEYSNNHSANNYDETFAPGLFKYTFRSGAAFADFIINGGDVKKPKKFNWRPYCGIGAAYSFGFNRIFNEKANLLKHPWQDFTESNLCFAFRYGLMLEYDFSETFGIYLDGTHEWFTDNYNGVSPEDFDGKHAGFPFDMKLNANLGVAIHF